MPWIFRVRRLFLGPRNRGPSGCTVRFQLVGNPWKFYYTLDFEGTQKCREMSGGAGRLERVLGSWGDHWHVVRLSLLCSGQGESPLGESTGEGRWPAKQEKTES